MNILSIQSHVAAGHVGNMAATLPLNRLGHEVWAVPTVLFSNHPAHGSHTGRAATADEIGDLVDGLHERGMLADCAAVLSGYLGTAANGEAVLEAVTAARTANPRTFWACDPVMGDVDRGFFVAPDVPEFFRERVVGRANILLPNPFELGFLADRAVETVAQAVTAARVLCDAGTDLVIVTGLRTGGDVAVLAVQNHAAWQVRTPWVVKTQEADGQPPPANDPGGPDQPIHGAGDAFAALFLGHYLQDADVSAALARAVSAMYELVRATMNAPGSELRLIDAQDRMMNPTEIFAPETVD